MVRGLLHILRLRKENILSSSKEETKKEVLIEDNKNNESKSDINSWSFFSSYPLNSKPQTADVAVGDDENKWSKFFCLIRLHKTTEPVQTDPKGAALDKFVNSFQREALIATREVIASTCSSLFSVLFSHPLDVIKSNYQMLRYPRTIQSPYFRRRKFIYVIRNIYMTKGVKRFYKNLWKSQQETALHVISVFWTYQRVRQFFEENFEIRNEDAANFLAGCVSATVPVLVLFPLHNYSQRREIKQKFLRYYGKSAVESFHKQLKYWRPFYRGGFAMFVHMSVQHGLRFMIYYKIRDHLAHLKTTMDKATDMNPYVTEVDSIVNFSNYELLLAGALAAILGDILAHPLDVIRSRLAMTTLMRQQYRYEHTCRRFFQCIKLIWKNERISAFYAGITPCVMRSTINMALTFAAYEKMRDGLRPFFPT